MARASHIQTAFNGGEWRGTLSGRIDQPRYRVSCLRCRNFIPLVEGPAEKRPGMRMVKPAASSDISKPATLIPFKFNTEIAYVLELGDFVMRFFRDNGIVESTPGVPYTIATPYPAADTHAIQFKQSADVMFMAHPSYPPQRLSRLADTSWTLTDYDPDWAPFGTENIDDTLTVFASAATGAGITLTASGDLFEVGRDEGRLFRLRELLEAKQPLWAAGVDPINIDTGAAHVDGTSTIHWEGNVYLLASSPTPETGTRPPIHTAGTESDGKWTWTYLHSGSGYVRIVSVTSPTVAVADVIHRIPGSCVGAAGTNWRWAFGAWDTVSKFPRTLCFFEDRLWWGGADGYPDRIWATRPGGNYDDFRPSEDAEGALEFRLNSDEPNVIETMIAAKVLYLLTAGGVFPATGADPALAISIENLLSAERHIAYGSKAGVQAMPVDNVVVFVPRSGRSVREVLFDFDQDSFVAPDIAKVAAHLIEGGIVRLAYQQEPYRTLYALNADGTLAAATYDRPQEVIGWYKIEPGGSAPFVESVAVIPHPDQDQDQVWVAIRRTLGGTTTRTIEFFEKSSIETTAIEDAFYVDSGASYSGAPVITVTGLSHLEGQLVRILADGARQPDQTVSGGSVTLDTPSSKVHVGLGYDGLLLPERFEAGGDDGTSQGKTKRIHRAIVRLFRTGEGLYLGASETLLDMDEVVFRDAFDLMTTPVPLVDYDTRALEWPGEHEQGGFFYLRHSAPTPCTIVAIVAELMTGER